MLGCDIAKMEICQYYHFNDDSHHDIFVIDFENGKAYWDPKYFFDKQFWFMGIQEDGLEANNPKNHRLFKMLDSRVTHDEYRLNDVDTFLEEIDKIKIFEQFNPSESSNSLLSHVKFLHEIHITLFSVNSKEHYVVDWQFPESWLDFAELLENLVGFDVLNIENSKYFVSQLDYNLSNDWIVDNKEFNELILSEIRFNYCNHICGYMITDWIIELSKKTLRINTYNSRVPHMVLSDEVLKKLMVLLRKYHVFSWTSKESWSNLMGGSWKMIDGYIWCLEFEFDNGAIYNVGGYNVHPNEYFDFGKEIEELIISDLLRLDDCNDWSILNALTPYPISNHAKHDFFIVYYNDKKLGFCFDEEIERYKGFFPGCRILFQKVSMDNLFDELKPAKY